MAVFVEDAAQSLASADVEVGEPGLVGASCGTVRTRAGSEVGVVGFSRGSGVLFAGGELVDEKSCPPMPVEQPVQAGRVDMLALIADGDQVEAADALLSLAYPERAWLEGVLTRIIEDPETGPLRALAIAWGTSLESTVLSISRSLFPS